MKLSDHRKHSPNVKNALEGKEKLQTNLYGLVGNQTQPYSQLCSTGFLQLDGGFKIENVDKV